MCAAKIKKPVVIQSKEFLEIAGDFANPLEITREAISNSFDANARNIWLSFSMEEDYDEKIFKITIKDDGEGMNEKELEAFYDLGNSTRRNDKEKIGEKGHGTKVYLNSNKIEVITVKNNKCLKSKMNNMKKLLYKGQIPEYTVEEINKIPFSRGTEIIITGFNKNKTDKFTHERLKDYILWFTKFGSIDKEFGINKFIDAKIYLKGIDKDKYETLNYGHVFPLENSNTTKLLDTFGTDAPEYYCRRWDFQGVLKAHPFIKYKAVFYIEGNKVKQSYNSMIKRPGPHEPEGAYRVQDRYGLWLCKDYIPIERMNSWITTKGNEYTKFRE